MSRHWLHHCRACAAAVLALLAIGAAGGATGCRNRMSGGEEMSVGTRLADSESLTVTLANRPLAERLAAVKQLLYALDDLDDIECPGLFETGLVVVTVPTGPRGTGQFADVDFHMAWPEPQFNNQHLSVVRLVSWTVAGLLGDDDATKARLTAKARLQQAIEELTGPGAALEGAIARRIEQ